jgi:hypothetical protein
MNLMKAGQAGLVYEMGVIDNKGDEIQVSLH